jgi:outer membrane protein assembly factor BamB
MAAALITLAVIAAPGDTMYGADAPSEVTTYRGNAAHTGEFDGPAPGGRPQIVWRYRGTAGLISSPLAVGGLVFQASRDGVVRALSIGDGAEVWATDLGAALTATPLVTHGALIIGDEASTLHALDTGDGHPRWRSVLDGPVSGAAVIEGETIVIATRTGSAFGVDRRTGAVTWRAGLGGPVERSVAVSNGVAYLGVTPATVVAVSTDDGTERWRRALGDVGLVFTPSAVEGRVFAAIGKAPTGSVTALDAETGDPLWTYVTPRYVTAHTPSVSAGRATVVRSDGRVEALDSGTGAVLWSIQLIGPIYTQPAVVGDVAIVASAAGSVDAIDAATGTLRWSVDIRGAASSLVVADGRVLVPTDLGILYAIGTGVR